MIPVIYYLEHILYAFMRLEGVLEMLLAARFFQGR